MALGCEQYDSPDRFESFRRAAIRLTFVRLGMEQPENSYDGDDTAEQTYAALLEDRSFVDARSEELGWLGALVRTCGVDDPEYACEGCPIVQAQARIQELHVEAEQARGMSGDAVQALARQLTAAATDGNLGSLESVGHFGRGPGPADV